MTQTPLEHVGLAPRQVHAAEQVVPRALVERAVHAAVYEAAEALDLAPGKLRPVAIELFRQIAKLGVSAADVASVLARAEK